MSVRNVTFPVKLLRLSLGIFFIVIGVYGVMQNINESIFNLNVGGRSGQTIEILFGIVEIICGLLLLGGLFIFSSSRSIYYGSLVVLIFWLIRVILTKFVWGLTINNGGFHFTPSLSIWVLSLLTELIIASGILVIVYGHD